MFDDEDKHAFASSALAAGGAVATAMTLSQWVALATLVYVTLQIGLLIPKYISMYKEWRNGR